MPEPAADWPAGHVCTHIARIMPSLSTDQVASAAELLKVLAGAASTPRPQQLLTARDVAEVFGVSAPQVLRWTKIHGWPHVKIGARYWFRRVDIDDIVARHLVDPGRLTARGRPRRRREPQRRASQPSAAR